VPQNKKMALIVRKRGRQKTGHLHADFADVAGLGLGALDGPQVCRDVAVGLGVDDEALGSILQNFISAKKG
jgi:hypothetical protein